MSVKCFLLVPGEMVSCHLEITDPTHSCEVSGLGYCGARERWTEPLATFNSEIAISLHSERMPKQCGCGYVFPDDANRSGGSGHNWKRTDTGEEYPNISDAPPGAMWDAPWLHNIPEYHGPDGLSLIVKLPNGREWCIDSRANNCDMPTDTKHKCWVRHGEPPNLTVDKQGLTCGAGAGSIQCGDYHGFLQNGFLT